jgi:hypothetical protein
MWPGNGCLLADLNNVALDIPAIQTASCPSMSQAAGNGHALPVGVSLHRLLVAARPGLFVAVGIPAYEGFAVRAAAFRLEHDHSDHINKSTPVGTATVAVTPPSSLGGAAPNSCVKGLPSAMATIPAGRRSCQLPAPFITPRAP